jgi:hypothetical protein
MTKRILFFAAVALTLLACSGSDPDDSPNSSSIEPLSSSSQNSILLNFTSDFESGELRWMDLNSTSLSSGALSFDQDSKVSAVGEDIFVLSRYPGVLSCFKARDIGNERTIKQGRLKDKNPYELVIIGDKGYIVLWDTDYIQMFNPSTCTLIGEIPLPELKNSNSIKASGDTLLVTMQRLEWDNLGMSPKTPSGLLVRINVTTETAIDTISLKLYNPHSTVLSKGKLYISQNGLYDPNMEVIVDGAGLEAVDLAAATTEVLITGQELGGGIQSIALDEEEQIVYMLVYREWRDAPIIPFDLKTKTAGSPLPNVIDGFGGIKWDEVARKLFIGERDLYEFGLKVYDPATKTTTKIRDNSKYPLPPYSQAIARW